MTIHNFDWKNDQQTLSKSLLPLFFLAAVASIYFGTFYRYRFDWGDMGSYAQISYELSLGARPGEFLGYGPLWYFLGQALFHLWGVDFVALLVMFQIIIFLSAVLLFLGVRAAVEQVWPAVLASLLFILVPPYFASAIRSISLGLFLLPYILLARAERGRDRGPLMLTAASIGLIFQLRPDFGYIFSGLLLVLLVARSWHHDASVSKRVRGLVRSIFISAAVVTAVSLPLALHAVLNGYWQPVLADLLSYPRRLLYVLLNAGGLSDMLGNSSEQEGTFLRILPVTAIYGVDRGDRVFAFLIYSTLLVLVAFAVHLLVRWARQDADVRGNILRLAIFLVVGSQWAPFGMFRPDWSHFVSFMHAYLVLAACIVVWIVTAIQFQKTVKRTFGAFVILVLAVQMALFVGYGELDTSMGWWGTRRERDVLFQAGNGVKMMVSSAEQRYLDSADRIIRGNSRRGDEIICVPYCAGFAFMTERRLLFKQHYVDDGIPLIFPGWIDKAIAATAAAHVPVIIVLNWATNGTEASRFDVWARRYMDFVRRTYPVSVSFEFGTIWLLREMDPGLTRTASVTEYGPVDTAAGHAFNVQPDGRSALWMRVSERMSTGAMIFFDEKPLVTVVDDTLVTAVVPPEMFAASGRHSLRVVDKGFNVTTQPVPFDVTSP